MTSYKQKINKFLNLVNKSEFPQEFKLAVFQMLVESKIDVAPADKVDQKDDLTKLTNNQLKEICKAKGLPVSGKKSDLIKRIHNIPEERKESKIFSEREKTKINNIKTKIGKYETKKLTKDGEKIFDKETGFEFNDEEQVIGRFGKKLTAGDYNALDELNYNYKIPKNLDDIYNDLEEETIHTRYNPEITEEEEEFIQCIEEDDEDEVREDDDE